MERGLGAGGRAVNKSDHLILPFREHPCRSESQFSFKKFNPVKMFFFFFSPSLDTYRENEEFDRECSHCLPLDFRLLAVDGFWLFL